MVLADHPQATIYVGQYGHRKTGCVAGMLVRPIATNMSNDPRWAQAIQWAIGDFPF